MPYQVKYTEKIQRRATSLRFREDQLRGLHTLTNKLKGVDDPHSIGGKYKDGWAYTFASGSLLCCDIDDERKIIYLMNIVL